MGLTHTKLSNAIYENNEPKVKKLLNKYPEIVDSALNESGTSPLMMAVSLDRISIVRFMLNKFDVDLDKQTFDGETAAIKAAKFNHLDILKELVKAGCDLESEDVRNRNCLDFAMLYGNVEVCKFLVRNNMELKNKEFYQRFEIDFSGRMVNFSRMRELIKNVKDLREKHLHEEINVPTTISTLTQRASYISHSISQQDSSLRDIGANQSEVDLDEYKTWDTRNNSYNTNDNESNYESIYSANLGI
jgi:hypothetical protein